MSGGGVGQRLFIIMGIIRKSVGFAGRVARFIIRNGCRSIGQRCGGGTVITGMDRIVVIGVIVVGVVMVVVDPSVGAVGAGG